MSDNEGVALFCMAHPKLPLFKRIAAWFQRILMRCDLSAEALETIEIDDGREDASS